MPFCKNCGAEFKEDAKFCPKCGTPMPAEERARPRPSYAKEREACFGPPGSGGGLWGAISFGVFIIGLAILWLLDYFWPGILILIGLMVIIGGLVGPHEEMKMKLSTSNTNANSRERLVCFGERIRIEDYVGLISFGIFLIIVGIVFIASPNIVSNSTSWVRQMADQKEYVRPPKGLITGAMIFFGLIGLSEFFKAGIKLWTEKSKRKGFSNIFSGIALVLFAYLLYLYSEHLLRGVTVLAVEVVAVGFLVIIYSILRAFLK